MSAAIFVDYCIVYVWVQCRDLSVLGYKIQHTLHFLQGIEEGLTARKKHKVISLNVEKLLVLKLETQILNPVQKLSLK